MWFDASAPHRLVRFEGPYGPPGAPEILLELAALDRALVRSSSREPSVMDHAARVQLIA
jgi:hypothetical protein